MERINRPRGTADLLPRQTTKWQQLEEIAREVCRHFHVREIRTPLFEHTELFIRGVGDGTDIVEKEMYTFLDKGGRSLTLRPEGTSAVARAVLENKLYVESLPLKLYYLAPMFRYERPGTGRLRQHHQFGIELVGTESASADVEVMALAMRFYEELGASELTLVLNSVGCAECRPQYRQELLEYLELRLEAMCEDCQRRAGKNPLRILDCKESCCQAGLLGAPSIQECLCEGCQSHFGKVVQGLEALGLPYRVDAKLVRGLDYYTRTVFEVMTATGATVSAGGRYNGLYAELGGLELAAVGFGAGLERALLLLEEQGISLAEDEYGVDVYLIPLGETAEIAVLPVLDALRRAGLSVERDFSGKGLKAALKRADRIKAKVAVIAGEAELVAGKLMVKELETGAQELLSLDELLSRLGG
ncbi:histidine--tRNA ligase [Tumebacillus algifaecis]|uniref:Histidine--tRNA ligase n=1 Tax=Tumebacillus algifaecis TaxID=1214604 RepID=A0A223D4M7_9BACL|nr:histidine--tRNA ligase [Tumebacillus algifaecis]ASS76383.1 histidine--tRNA ligase [Tumebacillus algifaecis]